MQMVSPQFQPAIESPKRQVKARVHLDLVGNFVDKGAAVTASSSQNAVAMAPAQAINSRTAPRRKWAAANFLTLDGSYHPIPADGKEETGWWGGKRSSEVGALKQDGSAPTFSRASVAYKQDGTQVASGQPRYEPGKFGQAWRGEEGTENLVPSWPAGWVANFAPPGSNLSATDMGAQSGAAGSTVRLTNSGTNEGGYGNGGMTLSPSTTYTIRMKVRGTVGPGTFDVHVLSNTGTLVQLDGNAFPGISWAPTTAWQVIEKTFMTTADITGANQYIRLDHNGNDAGYIEIAEIQIEQKSYATTFAGYGATRSPESLTIPTAGVLSSTEGTIELSYIPNYNSSVFPALGAPGQDWAWFFGAGAVMGVEIRLAYVGGAFKARIGNTEVGYVRSFTAGEKIAIALAWKQGQNARLLINGVNVYTFSPDTFTFDLSSVASVGWSSLWNGYRCNGLIDDLRISSIARSDAEILAAYQSGQPLAVDKWTTYKLPLDETLAAEQATNETLTITFPARKVKTLWWHGDAIRGWYPTDFKVEYYDSQAAAWVLVADVTGWASPYWETSLAAITAKVVTQIRLTITKVAPAGSCACILEFDATVTETYEGDDLVSLGLLEEMEADTGTLAIGNISSNEVDLRLNNIDRRFNPGNTASPYYGLLKPNRRIRPYLGVVVADGTTEYVPLGVFWSGDWDARADSLEATTSGQDLLKFMAESTFSVSQVYVNKTLYDLAVIVLQDYGLQDTDYEIDADLTNYVIPYAWFDKTSHRAALQRIAEAGLAAVFMARDGLLKIKSYRFLAGATSLGQVSDQVHIMSSNNPQRNSQVVNTVEVEANPLKADVSKVIYQTTEAVTVPAGGTKSLTVFFTEKPVINVGAPALSGATNTVVQSWSAYAWGGDLVLSNPGGAAENVSLTVSGQPLVEAGRILAKAQDATRVAEEGVIKKSVSNDLIQTTALAQSIADAILAVWSNAAKDVVSQVRGDPSWELGDRRTWADDRANVTGDHVIIRQRLEYDGGLAGEVTGRRV